MTSHEIYCVRTFATYDPTNEDKPGMRGTLHYQLASNLVTTVLLYLEVKWTYTLFDKHATPRTDSATLTEKETRSSDKLVDSS